MRILITGINGFVGGYLAEALLATDQHTIWGLARQAAKVGYIGPVTYVAADLRYPAEVMAAIERVQPEVIYHLAGQANVPRSFIDPAGTLETNVIGQSNLFQALIALKQDPLILVAGSNEIYGAVLPSELPLTEETPLRPANPYAVSKAAQDLLAQQYFISHRLRTIRLRPFNHIGPRQSEAFVVASFAAQIARIEAGLQEPLIRVGNLDAERDFTDVRDMVNAYLLAAERAEPGQAYNIGSGRATRIQQILDTLCNLSSAAITIEHDPARMRPSDVPSVVCDLSRFRAATGWKPQYTLQQTLSDILQFWRERTQEQL